MSITIDSTIEQVNKYLKEKLNINEEILKKIKEEKIDGEALILLRKCDFKNLGIKLKDRNIIKNIEKNILKMKSDVEKDDLYGKIPNLDSANIWDFLEFNNMIKLGDKLKYIKYVFIKYQPPHKDKKDELYKYFQKFLKLEENIIGQIIENLNDFLSYQEQDFEEQCQELNILEEDEQYKLKLIIELIKSHNKTADELLSETTDINKKIKKIKINGKNLHLNINLRKLIGLNVNDIISLKGDYNLFSMIEIYDYGTSQNEITRGLRNPISEFQKLCNDFEIECKNECTYINYDQALKIFISLAMVWGTKESLNLFFKENEINNAIDYFKKEDIKNKAGIYLCINKKNKNCLLIVWPGKLNYKYSKIEEPNNNLLLTLIRYGFSVAPNSILCFTDDEIKNINFEGYEIFKEIDSSGFQAERSKILINVIKEKSFNIGEKKELKIDGIKFENKINNKLINQNCLLLFEEKDNSNPEIITDNIINFAKYNSDCDYLFDNSLDDIKPAIFYYLIRKNHIYLKDINKETMFVSKKSLKDVFRRKLDEKIDLKLKNLYELLKINKDNIDRYIKCDICCQYKKDEQLNEFFYLIKNERVIYFHKNCYNKTIQYKYNIIKSNNIDIISLKNITDNEEKLINYHKYKEYIQYKIKLLSNLSKNDYMYEIISKLFQNCEEKFNYLSKIFDEKIILDEIESIKEKSAEHYFDNLKNVLIKEEIEIREKFISNNEKIQEWKNYWIEKINEYIKENNFKNYIKIISCNKINNENSARNQVLNWKILYEVIKYNKKETYINLYEIKPIHDSFDLTLTLTKELGEESTFENYFPSYNENSIIINKNRDKLKVKFKNKTIEEKIQLYDYDKMSDTLVLYR